MADALYFDAGTEINAPQKWLVLDGQTTMMSFAVADVRCGAQKLVFQRNQQPLVVWSKPYGDIQTMDDMRAWIAETNPGVTTAWVGTLSGTVVAFLWLLSYGRQHLEHDVGGGESTPVRRVHIERWRYHLLGHDPAPKALLE